jgi:two-component system, NarL family, response regulator
MITVLLVDDHPAYRVGVAAVLGHEKDLQVIGEAGNAQEAHSLFRDKRPQVTVLDLRLPGVGGVEIAIALIKEYPQARILILTTYDGDYDIQRVIRAGAAGYLLKDSPISDLVEAIRAVAKGETYFDQRVKQQADTEVTHLTIRENELLQLIVAGCSNKESAKIFGVSEETIKSHVKNLLKKLGVLDRTQAAVAALRRGFVKF